MKEKGWRHRYDRHVLAHVRASLRSPQAALESARAGLAELHNTFEFIRDGKTRTVADAMNFFHGKCETGVIDGSSTGAQAKREFELPYDKRTLRGQEIVDQANKWAALGVLEVTLFWFFLFCA